MAGRAGRVGIEETAGAGVGPVGGRAAGGVDAGGGVEGLDVTAVEAGDEVEGADPADVGAGGELEEAVGAGGGDGGDDGDDPTNGNTGPVPGSRPAGSCTLPTEAEIVSE